MGSYLARRFLLMVLTLFGMSVLIFVMLRLVPGNIADILVDASGADPRDKVKIAHELGIDRPNA
jgi:peptide/nickel transport system permease protein